MAVLVDTCSVAVEHRREAWAQAHAHALFPLSIDFVSDSAFVGRSESHQLGSLSLLRIRGSPCMVRRTPHTIRVADPEQLVLALVLRGHCLVAQDGRQTDLQGGDLTTWTSSRPFQIPHRDGFDLMLLSVPAAAAGLRRGHQTACRTPGSHGPGAIAAQLIRESWRQLEQRAVCGSDPDLQDALLAVARAVAGDADGGGTPALSGARRLYALEPLPGRARAYAERHLDEPTLDPASIARAHHVSLRRLYAAFEAEPETLSAWIRRRRLERCREDLLDPACDHVPVGAIAVRWGFANHSHFSRAFRDAFGSSPQDLRRRRPQRDASTITR